MDPFEKVTDLITENKTIIILILVLCLLYYHFTSTFAFFKERGIPYKNPTIFFGNIGARVLMKKSFREFNLQLYRDFDGERYAGYFEGRRPILIIRDSELVKAIVIKDFNHFVDRVRLTPNEPSYINRFVMNLKGQEWRAVRSLITPCFSSARIRAMVPLIDECVSRMIKRTDASIKDNPEIEMMTVMNHLTLDIISSCVFGIESAALKGKGPNFIKVAEQFTIISGLKQVYNFFILLLTSEAAKYLVISFWNLAIMHELREILIAIKNIKRRDPANRRNDFLQLLLDLSDKEKEELAKNLKQVQHLNEETIDGQALQFMLAGYETTSSALIFTTYLLALHPEIQTKLRKEVKEVTARYNGEINYDSINDMHYMEAVLLESMRIYPALSIVDRECVKKYTLPDSNVTLMPGQRVVIPLIGLHMDPQYYPEPEKFKPERFLGEEKGTRPSHLYLPFGAGPRNCIGMRFATVESKLAIARFITEFQVAPGSKTQVPIQLSKKGILVKPEQGAWVKVSPVSF